MILNDLHIHMIFRQNHVRFFKIPSLSDGVSLTKIGRSGCCFPRWMETLDIGGKNNTLVCMFF